MRDTVIGILMGVQAILALVTGFMAYAAVYEAQYIMAAVLGLISGVLFYTLDRYIR